jgi:hypothetical protein
MEAAMREEVFELMRAELAQQHAVTVAYMLIRRGDDPLMIEKICVILSGKRVDH